MSIPFNDPTGGTGIIQLIEKNCAFNPTDISGNTSLLTQFTADVNLAVDWVTQIILQSSGEWQYDDTNYTDYPIITTNLVNGQFDYPFVTDGAGNFILDIYRVMVASSTGIFSEISAVSQKATTTRSGNAESTTTFINVGNASGATGTPQRYDKTGNSLLLDPVPNYNLTNGLKVFINRESQHFSTSDTTKKPGFAGVFHEYLALRPSYQYAYRRKLKNKDDLKLQVDTFERAIQQYYSKRDKDFPRRLIANVESTR